MRNIILAVFITVSVAGCANVRTDVNKFGALPGSGKSFIIVPFNEQKGSAEFATYAPSLSRRFQQQGFVEEQVLAKADYAIFFSYGVAGSETVSGAAPIYGQTGGGTSYQSGTYSTGGAGYGTYSGTNTATPTYGMVGMIPISRTYHSRFLRINMIDIKKSTPETAISVWEAQASSEGTVKTFAPVAECIFDSVFKDFRAVGSKRVDLTMSGCGKP
jgi:hypothetical protein